MNINPYYEKRNYKCNYGLVSMGLQKLLPINGRVCLCLYDRNVYERHCKEPTWVLRTNRIVNKINQLIAENAYEQIFFHTSVKEQYIRALCKHQKNPDNKGRIEFIGKDKSELIWTYKKSIWTTFLLPCIKIKKKSLLIPLPSHMDGLIRPEVQQLYDELIGKTES